ncbi:hypothetical protein DACRYDRAFT_50794 [Dacryopinax primogenitus]|uniref:Uncharacterized protein n=1 Tax=Dacryopinax primogenitus (strain DJM 731) TaxID=1858805 RepID=M5G242_DACPD|nr:uncharacterized protein DACRYDRAFT_50794 [Dacryopinax primogenitus]EJU02759.1 hypothetical protein DACRYDRAFT_50794 [Dacryopinax primogenitus]
MPLRTSCNTLKLESNAPTDLQWYFDDFEQCAESNKLSAGQCSKYAARYTLAATEVVWKKLPSFKGGNYDTWKADIYKLYPGTSQEDEIFTYVDLEEFMWKLAMVLMSTQAQLGEYICAFHHITRSFGEGEQLSEREKNCAFMQGLHIKFTSQVLAKLAIEFPKHHLEIPYPMSDVQNTASWLLHTTPADTPVISLSNIGTNTRFSPPGTSSNTRTSGAFPLKAEPVNSTTTDTSVNKLDNIVNVLSTLVQQGSSHWSSNTSNNYNMNNAYGQNTAHNAINMNSSTPSTQTCNWCGLPVNVLTWKLLSVMGSLSGTKTTEWSC